jgi:hypothetical protein
MNAKAFAVALLLLVAMTACNRSQKTVVPDELIGEWTTSEPAYQNRSLKFTKDFVEIGFEEDATPTIQRVTKVDVVGNGPSNIYTIYSGDKEGLHQITVYFDPTEGETIVLKNVRGNWRKR